MNYSKLLILSALCILYPNLCLSFQPLTAHTTVSDFMNMQPQVSFGVPAGASSADHEKSSLRQPVGPVKHGFVKASSPQGIESRPINSAVLRKLPETTPFQDKVKNTVYAPLGKPPVKAKAMFCVDCSTNEIILAQNTELALPIASITKLLTAMVALDCYTLEHILEVPSDIMEVDKHRVGIRPGDRFTVSDLLHGMLIESGNDCAEVLARGYSRGGRDAFMALMNKKAAHLGVSSATFHTPSGLDARVTVGFKDGKSLDIKRPNVATAEDVAIIARHAFKNTLIRSISSMKTYTMKTQNSNPKDYPLISNDRLLSRNLPVAGAKTGFTNLAGKCIVALFKKEKTEHMIVVLNTAQHFKAAERIYKWAARSL